MAKKAEEQSELQKQALIVGHRLNIIMALFLPATAVASLLGMNITNGLESETSRNFMIVVIVTSLLGLVMRYWVLKKPRISFSEKSSEF
jgi:Mg2+ and Co2+ transporter CorA